MTITDWQVGDDVVITKNTLKIMWNGSRSIRMTPNSSYIKRAEECVGIPGKVTHRFRPGYEMTVEFANGQSFHMKDHYVEKA